MSMQIRSNVDNAVLFEKVMLKSDLAGLTPIETVQHIKNVCDSLGLNALTNPIEVLEFQGKRKLYVSKQATEQLRALRRVSIEKIETKMHEGGLYTVIAYASLPDGRKDSSTGAISINGLKGDALGNAMMKAETKAKRRVTLSICGLGFMDESEADSIQNATKINVMQLNEAKVINDKHDLDGLEKHLELISLSESMDELQNTFEAYIGFWKKKKNIEAVNKIIEAKDKRKGEITVIDFNKEIDVKTGEVNEQ